MGINEVGFSKVGIGEVGIGEVGFGEVGIGEVGISKVGENPKYHLYADDTQLYISFTPSNSTSSLDMLSNTFSDIYSPG